MLQVSWVQCTGGVWCSLDRVDLTGVPTEGVYIIWHSGNPGRIVRIGQGRIADRLMAHRRDPEVTAYRASGNLHVTWAAVSAAQRDGVEAYLAEQLNPLVGDAFPDVYVTAVNLPW